MLIIITGLDGSGTSTIAERLHKLDQGSFLFHTPSKEFSDRSLIDTNVRDTSQLAHYYYYLSSVIFMSDYIKKNIDFKTQNVYCVRYLIDTVVSHQAAGLDVSLDYDAYGILKPDMTIFVSLDENIRQERISKRGKSHLDEVLDIPTTRNKFLECFSNLLSPSNTIYFNNSGNDIDKRVMKIYDTILGGKYYEN